jgi:hypothetical protein
MVWQGLCTGVLILFTTGGKSSHIMVFSEDLFFIYLLPPIIFNAGSLSFSIPFILLFGFNLYTRSQHNKVTLQCDLI